MPILISPCSTTFVPSTEAFTSGKRAQGLGAGAHEEGHEGEFGLVALLEFAFGRRAQLRDVRHVGFVDRVDVRRDALREHHVLGDALAHHAHRLHLVTAEVDALARHRGLEDRVRHRGGAGCVRLPARARAAGGDRRQNIALADAPAGSGAAHRGQIDVVLPRQPPHQGRAANRLAVSALCRRGGWRRAGAPRGSSLDAFFGRAILRPRGRLFLHGCRRGRRRSRARRIDHRDDGFDRAPFAPRQS